MPNNIQPVNFFGAEQQGIDQRKRIAEALQQQAMQPNGGTDVVGGWAVQKSPWEGVGKLAQALSSAKIHKDVQAEQQDLLTKQQGAQSGDLQRLISAMQGTPAQTIQPDPQEAMQSADFGTPPVGPANIPAQNPQQALMGAIPQMQSPMGQQMGSQIMGQMAGSMVPKKPEPFTLAPGAVRYDSNGQPIAFGQPEMPAKPPAPAPFNLAPGHTRYDETGKALVTAPDKPEAPAKVPPGYRMAQDGSSMEAIPGGPADLKLQGAFNQDTAALSGSTSSMDRLANAANELMRHPGLKGITGLRGAIPNIPGSDAANAQAKLNTLKSQVGFGVLQDMRNNSRTGGALGSVSDAEGKRLEANLASLENAQSEDQMRESLQNILDYTGGAKVRLQQAFNMKHGGAPSTAVPQRRSTDRLSPEETKELEDLRKRFGR